MIKAVIIYDKKKNYVDTKFLKDEFFNIGSVFTSNGFICEVVKLDENKIFKARVISKVPLHFKQIERDLKNILMR